MVTETRVVFEKKGDREKGREGERKGETILRERMC